MITRWFRYLRRRWFRHIPQQWHVPSRHFRNQHWLFRPYREPGKLLVRAPDGKMRCFWCNTNPEEAAARHEGPHATWCPHYKLPVVERVRRLYICDTCGTNDRTRYVRCNHPMCPDGHDQ